MAETSRLYAGTQDGMVVARQTGSGYEVVNHVFQGRVLESVAGSRSDPLRVYAGVAYDGLYRTVDGGLNWTKILDGDVRATSIDPTDEDVVYTGLEGVYLYRSDDRGDTWTENAAIRLL